MKERRGKSRSAGASPRTTLLFAIFALAGTLASGQVSTSQHASDVPRFSYEPPDTSGFPTSSSAFTRLRSQNLEGPYRPITLNERLQWFAVSTIGPAHTAGVAFVSAGGTAVNRPRESGPHWRGVADRFGTGMAGSAVGNAIEIGVGLGLREDPRYFREPQEAVRFRVGRAAKLTLFARAENGKLQPAYARFLGVVGGNFLSNSWRDHSEANTRDALIRSSEGFAGHMAANAFEEFWPDAKRYLFHKHHGAMR